MSSHVKDIANMEFVNLLNRRANKYFTVNDKEVQILESDKAIKLCWDKKIICLKKCKPSKKLLKTLTLMNAGDRDVLGIVNLNNSKVAIISTPNTLLITFEHTHNLIWQLDTLLSTLSVTDYEPVPTLYEPYPAITAYVTDEHVATVRRVRIALCKFYNLDATKQYEINVALGFELINATVHMLIKNSYQIIIKLTLPNGRVHLIEANNMLTLLRG